MPDRLRRIGAVVAIVAGLWAPGGAAALDLPEVVRLDVTFAGLPVGVLHLAIRRTDGSYAATARLQPAGLGRLLPSARFEATVQGRLRAGRPQPLRYVEDVHTGRRESRTEIAWEGGVPRLLRLDPPRPPEPWHLDPAGQGGALDPMSAVLSVLADVPAERACALDLAVFDGRRRTQIVLAPAPDGEPGCDGVFRRVAGYDPEDLAERPEVPFRLIHGPGPGGTLRVIALEAAWELGTARLTRD
ncbi:DUF3108 domain-containing protein [Rhodobaculum claviforme]|nr:DUF3108 domain-containing protein [Rhodobaculum claviforme]